MEPVAGIGLAISLLGLLMSSIRNTTTTVYDFVEARILLENCIEQLNTAKHVLECWMDLWFRNEKVLVKKTSLRHWGQDGRVVIEQRFNSLVNAERHLQKLLHVQHPEIKDKDRLSPDEHHLWEQIRRDHRKLEFPGPTRQLQPPKHVKLLQRVVQALGSAPLLEKAAANYVRKVAELKTNSNIFWSARYSAKSEATPTPQQVEATQDAAGLADRFTRAVEQQLGEQAVRVQWSLVLGMMANVPDDCKPKEQGGLDMHFLSSDSGRYQLVRAQWLYHRGKLVNRVNTIPAELLGSIHDSLLTGGSQQEQQETLTDRARTALCVATWVTLLGDAVWLQGLRSDNIFHASCVSGHAALRHPLTYRHPKCANGTDGDSHSPFEKPEDIDLLLGVLLSELALGRHIRLCNRNAFEVKSADGYRRIDLTQLLEAVRKKSSYSYHRAVAHCFAWSGQPRKHNRGGRTNIHIERIVMPLQKYHEALEAEELFWID